MVFTHKDYLQELQPWTPPAMIQSKYYDAIAKIASELPLLPFGCFETWLSPEEERVDFNVLVRTRNSEYQLLVDHHKSHSNTNGTALSSDVIAMCEKWIHPDFHLRSLINGFWLIYDLVDPNSDKHYSWRYPELAKNDLNVDPDLKVEIPMQVLQSGLWDIPNSLLSEARRFIQDLHTGIQVHCIGINRRGANPCVRFSLMVPDIELITSFLREQQWAGNIEDMLGLIDPITDNISYYGFGLDIGDGLHPTVGLKIFVGNEDAASKMDRIAEHFCHKGLCSEAKRKALKNWIGKSSPNSDSLKHIGTINRMAYLKLVLHPEKASYVKAYNCYYSTMIQEN